MKKGHFSFFFFFFFLFKHSYKGWVASTLPRINVRDSESCWWSGNKWATTWQNQQNECAAGEDSDRPGHPPSLIRVFAIRMKIPWVLSYPLSAQRRLWSDWADAQADLSLRWPHTHFVGFVSLNQIMRKFWANHRFENMKKKNKKKHYCRCFTADHKIKLLRYCLRHKLCR